MMQFTIRFLGRFEVSTADGLLTDFHSDKTRALLAYLALEPQPHTRHALAALLWPDIGDKYALTNLRNTLYRLRQTLNQISPNAAEALLQVTRQTVRFETENVFVDVHRFQSGLEAASEAPHQQRADGHLEDVVALYEGELLAGFSLTDSPAFEEWLTLRREMLAQRALLAFRTLALHYEDSGAYAKAHAVAVRLLALDPLREDSHRLVIRMLAQLGQQEQALRQFEQMRQLLHTELNVAPSEESRALADRIVSGETGRMRAGARDKVEPSREAHAPAPPPPLPPSSAPDLLEVPDPGPFFGRTPERRQLFKWIVHDRCRSVAILGIGGMGKTTLAAQCARELASEPNGGLLDFVLWRSLLNAPPLEELLPPLLQTLSGWSLDDGLTRHRSRATDSLDEQLRTFLHFLREQRILLVLDNMESILEADRAGAFRHGYEPYGQLIQQIATREHQSHLLFTSRERPRGYVRLEGDSQLVRSLPLTGLDERAGHDLLAQRGLQGTEQEQEELIERYSGNPLALKLVADTVDEIFGGDITGFLAEESLVFDDIRAVLDQQFARLSTLESEILFWLAIEREPISLRELRLNFLHAPPQRNLLEAIRALQRRSLIERDAAGFALQNVVTEYLTERLVVAASEELETGELDLLHRHALIKVQVKEYVRQSQIRLILKPIHEQSRFGSSAEDFTIQMQKLVETVRAGAAPAASYAAGNVLNLLLHETGELNSFDLSSLSVRQAYLRGTRLVNVNFSQAEFIDCVFTDTFASIFATALSPTEGILAAGTTNGEVRLWRLVDHQPIHVFEGAADPAWAVAFSRDGILVASGSGEPALHLWNVQTGNLYRVLPGHTKAIRAVAFSPDGSLLASGSEDGSVRLWNAATGELHALLEGHSDWVYAVAFSPDGSLLASASGDHTIKMWFLDQQAEQPRLCSILTGHQDRVLAVNFSPNSTGGHHVLASGSLDETVRIWHVNAYRSAPVRSPVEKIEPVHTLQAHNGWINAVVFDSEGQLLASGGQDGVVRVWDMRTRQMQQMLAGHSNTVRSLAFAANDGLLASGSMDQTIRLWDPKSGNLSGTIQGHVNWVLSLAFSDDDNMLVTGSHDGVIRLWDVKSPAERSHHRRLLGHGGWVYGVASSSVGNVAASASIDGTVRLWDLSRLPSEIPVDGRSTEARRILDGHDQGVLSVAFSSDGQTLASGSCDETIRLWEVRSGLCLHVLKGHNNWVWSVDFSPDGTTLASGSSDGTVRVWEVSSGRVRYVLEGHTDWVRSVAFSRCGRYLASGGEDNTVRLWDVESGRSLRVLESQHGWILSIAFRPRSAERAEREQPQQAHETLACGSADGTIQLWALDFGTSEPDVLATHKLQGHQNRVESIAFSHGGEYLASASSDKTIRLWNAETGICFQTLHMPGPYEGTNINGVTGITDAQREALKVLGAVETSI